MCPGHPLLDGAVIDLTLERNRDLLKRGAVLIDERDAGDRLRVLFYLEHAIQDASLTRSGDRRVVSKRMLYVELDADGVTRTRALRALPRLPAARPTTTRGCGVDPRQARVLNGLTGSLEKHAAGYAVANRGSRAPDGSSDRPSLPCSPGPRPPSRTVSPRRFNYWGPSGRGIEAPGADRQDGCPSQFGRSP